MPDLLPPDLSARGLAFLLATAFVAAMARGFSGFGAALIFVPLATHRGRPAGRLAAPAHHRRGARGGLHPERLRPADRREVSIMALGAAIGIPLGTLMLVRLDALTIRWGIVVLAGAMLALLVSGWRYRGKPTPPLTFAVGGFAGVCTGAAQVGGPTVIAYWLGSTGAARHRARQHHPVFRALDRNRDGGLLLRRRADADRAQALRSSSARSTGSACSSARGCSASRTRAVFRRICYALIAVAVLVSLPVLDGVVR